MTTLLPMMSGAEREEWLMRRRQGIGASDVAVMLGLSPFKTALELYLEKRGEIEPAPMTPRMRLGLLIEPVIAAMYAEETGTTIEKGPPLLAHADAPWMLASLDYLADDRVVECKLVHPRAAHGWGTPGSDEIPAHYWWQVQQQMLVADRPRADVAALIGDELSVFTVPQVDGLFEELSRVEAAFMRRVTNEEPPLPDFEHATTLALLERREARRGAVVTLAPEWNDLADQYQRLAREIRDAERRREEIKARLLVALDGAEVGLLEDGRQARRQRVETKGYAVAPKTSYRLTIREPKGNDDGDR